MSLVTTIADSTAVAWHANRAYLVNLAYRMLRDAGAAEDSVQEAFLRLANCGTSEIRDLRGWLTVVTTRLCLDRIRSAHHRRERPTDSCWLEGADGLGSQPPIDPAERVSVNDEVRQALLVVLQRLGPAERDSFLLHDVFQLPFGEVAEILDKPPATCRQLAKRARDKVVRPDGRRQEIPDQNLHEFSETFLTACATGDLKSLTASIAR